MVDGESPEPEDRLGTVEAPASAGAIHSVLDEVTAGALDEAVKLHLQQALPSVGCARCAVRKRLGRGTRARPRREMECRSCRWTSYGRATRQPASSSRPHSR